MKLIEILFELPLSAQIVYRVLEQHEVLSSQEIHYNTHYSLRTIQYAIRQLVDTHLVMQFSDIQDPRSYKYSVTS
ncbi:MAG: MarR family transcriptional regulator [Candidatus Hodarchaeota archaeon]